jgi:hypothetical protein
MTTFIFISAIRQTVTSGRIELQDSDTANMTMIADISIKSLPRFKIQEV